MKKQKISLSQLITKWKLNQPLLAAKIRMPVGTFKNKLNENQTAYHLKDAEEQKLTEVLRELATDITILYQDQNLK